MGVHVELSGQGCREAEAAGVVHDWRQVFERISRNAWGVARLDLAVDDRSSVLEPAVIEAAFQAGTVVTRWREARKRGENLLDPAERGWLLHLGSPKSASRARIYDKAAEQGLPASEPWMRFELQLRDERAELMVAQLATSADPGEVVLGVIRGYVDFKERGSDGHRHRWQAAPWWEAFCRGVAKLRLGTAPEAMRGVEQVKSWLLRQVAPALALVVAADAGSMDWVYGALAMGRRRWRVEHRAMLAMAGSG
jgi:phage replication initiation protein